MKKTSVAAEVNQKLTQSGRKRRRMRMACFPCSKAKLSCDDQRPCSRCIKKGIEDQCTDREKPLNRTKPFGIHAKRAKMLNKSSTDSKDGELEYTDSQSDFSQDLVSEDMVPSSAFSETWFGSSSAGLMELSNASCDFFDSVGSSSSSSASSSKNMFSSFIDPSNLKFYGLTPKLQKTVFEKHVERYLLDTSVSSSVPPAVGVVLLRRHGYKKYSPILLENLLTKKTMNFFRFLSYSKVAIDPTEFNHLVEETFRIALVITPPQNRSYIIDIRSRFESIVNNQVPLQLIDDLVLNSFEISAFSKTFGKEVQAKVLQRTLMLVRLRLTLAANEENCRLWLSTNAVFPKGIVSPAQYFAAVARSGGYQNKVPSSLSMFSLFGLQMEDHTQFLRVCHTLMFAETENSSHSFTAIVRSPDGKAKTVLAVVTLTSANPQEDSSMTLVFKFLQPDEVETLDAS